MTLSQRITPFYTTQEINSPIELGTHETVFDIDGNRTSVAATFSMRFLPSPRLSGKLGTVLYRELEGHEAKIPSLYAKFRILGTGLVADSLRPNSEPIEIKLVE